MIELSLFVTAIISSHWSQKAAISLKISPYFMWQSKIDWQNYLVGSMAIMQTALIITRCLKHVFGFYYSARTGRLQGFDQQGLF